MLPASVHRPFDSEAARSLVSAYSSVKGNGVSLPPFYVRCEGRDLNDPNSESELCFIGIKFDQAGNYRTFEITTTPETSVPDLEGVSGMVEEMRALTGSLAFNSTIHMTAPLGTVSKYRASANNKDAESIEAIREKGVTIGATWKPMAVDKIAPLCTPSPTDCSAQMIFNGGDKAAWGNAVLAANRRLKRLTALCNHDPETGEWPAPERKNQGSLFDRVPLFLEEEKASSSAAEQGESEKNRFGEATMATWGGDATNFDVTGGAQTDMFGEKTIGQAVGGVELQERENLDMTDRLCVFLEGATELVDLSDTLDAILEALRTGDLVATVNKDNKTAIGNFVRAAGRLAHQRSRNGDVSELEETVKSTMERLLEDSLTHVLEISIHRANRDFSWWLLRDNAATSAQLEFFLARDVSVQEQVSRLQALQATVELLSMARSVHTPWERIQSLLATSLTFHRQRVNGSEVRPNFVMPLPPFVRSSSSLLMSLSDGPSATSWMLHLQNQSGAARVALLLQQSLMDPEASEDLNLPEALLPVEIETETGFQKQNLLKAQDFTPNPLDIRYVTYVGRCDNWQW